ncbi:MAG: homoserine O-acetyltransferase [Prevotellaceae bacterium]|jgi:homoserine O-acetyltransferase|nr:homoserine O-acetyltransferase [Prevotellaceae bacterium]
MVTQNYNGANVKYFDAPHPIHLECGQTLTHVQIAYHTYGTLNVAKNNVVWICHALTANSDAADWWPGMIGKSLLFDTDKYFVVCANVIGSCYGTTGPTSINPATGKPYYRSFPEVTTRDMIAAHEQLQKRLGIDHIFMLVGGSIGAFQALEWSIMHPELFDKVIISANGARATPWVIAQSEAQRMAIEVDATYYEDRPGGGDKGLAAARAMALVSYRNYHTYNKTQAEPGGVKRNDYRASSYQRYQGDKLVKRFDAYSYVRLTQAIDSFDVGRGRGSIEQALSLIKAQALVIGISSDCLFPVEEQKYMAKHIPNARYAEVDSEFGHDGFLIEHEKLTTVISELMK